MVSKKKCSSYGRELAVKHTTQSAIGLNACRWERRHEDTPKYDVVPPVKRTPHPKPKTTGIRRNTDRIRVGSPESPAEIKTQSKIKTHSLKPAIRINLATGETTAGIQWEQTNQTEDGDLSEAGSLLQRGREAGNLSGQERDGPCHEEEAGQGQRGQAIYF